MTIDTAGNPATAQPHEVGHGQPTQPPPAKPKLRHLVRQAIRIRHYSPRTEQAYVNWIRRYIFFHNVRHPAEMGSPSSTRSCRTSRWGGTSAPRRRRRP